MKVRSKIFNDAVHGHIELHPLSVKVIDTFEYQRLRDLKQLGGCYSVYSSASHNRFEHCLGVAHLARKFVYHLAEVQPELCITESDKICVELAGLIHDLGHGIFSHMFDSRFIPAIVGRTKWEHEHASAELFEFIIKKYNLKPMFARAGLNDDDIQFVQELVFGDPSGAPENFVWKGRGRKTFLYEIVSNSRNGMDVDKFDYFRRDCRALNMDIPFDALRLMKLARVLEGPDGLLQIAYPVKEAWGVYQMFHARYTLHKRAYLHKVSRVIETMYMEALVLADPFILVPSDLTAAGQFVASNGDSNSGVRRIRMSQCIHDMSAYSRLSDYLIRTIACSTSPELAPSRNIIHRIMNRKLYSWVGEALLPPFERLNREGKPIRDILDGGSLIPTIPTLTTSESLSNVNTSLLGNDSLTLNSSPANDIKSHFTPESVKHSARVPEAFISKDGFICGPDEVGYENSPHTSVMPIYGDGEGSAASRSTSVLDTIDSPESVHSPPNLQLAKRLRADLSPTASSELEKDFDLPRKKTMCVVNGKLRFESPEKTNNDSSSLNNSMEGDQVCLSQILAPLASNDIPNKSSATASSTDIKSSNSISGSVVTAAKNPRYRRRETWKDPQKAKIARALCELAARLTPQQIQHAWDTYGHSVSVPGSEGAVNNDSTLNSVGFGGDYSLTNSNSISVSASNNDLSAFEVAANECLSQSELNGISDAIYANSNHTSSNKPPAITLTEDDLLVDIVTINYGKGTQDPVENVLFYEEDKRTGKLVYRKVSKNQISVFVPSTFEEQFVRIYTREPQYRHLAAAAFERWTKAVLDVSDPMTCTPKRYSTKTIAE